MGITEAGLPSSVLAGCLTLDRSWGMFFGINVSSINVFDISVFGINVFGING
ncbi:MAG: hypothetical protein FWD57_14575 [Polyangiaceae bacterium]|nr:hypothetical protein [Polyangiaceae bacterium]